jgi:ribosomal protein L11 methyltransferase
MTAKRQTQQSDANQRMWYALDVTIEPQAAEAAGYGLMEAGALGTENNSGDNGLAVAVGYFAALPDREHIRAELYAAIKLYQLETSSIREMNLREVPDRDWLGEWRKNWQPVEVGRFIIAPPWSEVEKDADHIIIRIEPGMAFGTGTHETTRLCLHAMEKYCSEGAESFLDVGTGTGILAIAAAKLFPHARIEACDVDAEAIEIAKQNAVLNQVDNINFWAGTIDDTTASASCVTANLTADVIIPMVPQLVGASCETLILSGILTTQEQQVRDALFSNGDAVVKDVMVDGEWVAIVA